MAKNTVMEGAAHALGGEKEHKPKKEIKEIRIRKPHDGKSHIIEHHHTAPEHHPVEEHVTHGDDELADHILANVGTPNPGEAEADAGQSGIPEAAPNAGAPTGTAPAGAPPAASPVGA